jgi:hypothetical protein
VTKLVVPLAAALLVASAPDAGAARLPDAEVFAASTTEVITDPADPRLDVRLVGFKQQVARIISRGGGRPVGSELLDGVFFSSILGFTTFQRSREFDVDSVTPRELRAIADTVRRRFQQQSVLTFDYPDRRSDPVDAVKLEVPRVRTRRLREGFAANEQARERLLGGSVTRDHRLILIASAGDLRLARRFAQEIGGRVEDATIRRGRREFVREAMAPAVRAARAAIGALRPAGGAGARGPTAGSPAGSARKAGSGR